MSKRKSVLYERQEYVKPTLYDKYKMIWSNCHEYKLGWETNIIYQMVAKKHDHGSNFS